MQTFKCSMYPQSLHWLIQTTFFQHTKVHLHHVLNVLEWDKNCSDNMIFTFYMFSHIRHVVMHIYLGVAFRCYTGVLYILSSGSYKVISWHAVLAHLKLYLDTWPNIWFRNLENKVQEINVVRNFARDFGVSETHQPLNPHSNFLSACSSHILTKTGHTSGY